MKPLTFKPLEMGDYPVKALDPYDIISAGETYDEVFGYVLEYTRIYKSISDKYIREGEILKLQSPYYLLPPKRTDKVMGRVHHTFINYSPQLGGSYMWNFVPDQAQETLDGFRDKMTPEQVKEIEDLYAYWETEKTVYKYRQRFTELHSDTDPLGRFTGQLVGQGNRFDPKKDEQRKRSRSGVAGRPSARLALTTPDIDILIRKGLPGLREDIEAKMSEQPFNTFYQGLLLAIEAIQLSIDESERMALALYAEHPECTNLKEAADVLHQIRDHKPATFREGLQLYWIYAVTSDLMNHGRMDMYLGDLYAHDLETGAITEEEAIDLLTDLYDKYDYIHKIHDTRVIIGGKGRRNEENADKLAMVLMEVSRRVKGVVPQLTLRVYEGMNMDVYKKALEVNAEGCSYPILYSDETNIPAVMNAFGVDEEEAIWYMPSGCGEYIIEGRGVNTPNSSLNCQKAIEVMFHEGHDAYTGELVGPVVDLDSLETFDDFWKAYCEQIEFVMLPLAWGEKENYNLIAETGGTLHLSLLFHDCIERGKAMLEGGAHHVFGSTEVNGMITAADSLSVIKTLVYDKKVMTLQEMKKILDANFEGYEKERKMFQAIPHYGNDDPDADAMACKVYNQIAECCLALSEVVGLDRYMVCSVNNSDSASWGYVTMASPCGRKNGEALSNANSASIGADKNGATALLNSMSKFDHNKHAGVINNIRFTKQLFQESFDKMSTLLWTFLTHNGTQLNLMVIGKDDLENAQKHPEEYKNLIVRIGGFSARFVELDPVVQEEIIRRTTFES